jgi:hypothetical protein
LSALRDLAAAPADARSVEAACGLSAEVLERSRADVPFMLIYLIDSDGTARLAAQSGVSVGERVAPCRIAAGDGSCTWPACAVAESRQPEMIEDLAARFDRLPAGPWAEPPGSALVLPLIDRGLGRGVGAMVPPQMLSLRTTATPERERSALCGATSPVVRPSCWPTTMPTCATTFADCWKAPAT